MFTHQARFFDDYEHMLSVIGLLRFAMGIGENIVETNEIYEVEELKDDPTRTIKNSYLLQIPGEKEAKTLKISKHKAIVSGVPTQIDRPERDEQEKLIDDS